MSTSLQVLGVSRLEATTAKLNLIQPIPVKQQRLLQKFNYCGRDYRCCPRKQTRMFAKAINELYFHWSKNHPILVSQLETA